VVTKGKGADVAASPEAGKVMTPDNRADHPPILTPLKQQQQ
jgi:hypothetical protein